MYELKYTSTKNIRVLAAICWAIWKARNKACFEFKWLKHPLKLFVMLVPSWNFGQVCTRKSFRRKSETVWTSFCQWPARWLPTNVRTSPGCFLHLLAITQVTRSWSKLEAHWSNYRLLYRLSWTKTCNNHVSSYGLYLYDSPGSCSYTKTIRILAPWSCLGLGPEAGPGPGS